MNIVLLGVAVAGIAWLWNMGKTAAAAKDIVTVFKNAKIHEFASGGEMIIRLFVDFTNLHNTNIVLQAAALQVRLDGLTVGTCNVTNVVLTPGVNNKYFNLVMPWRNLGAAAAVKVVQWFSSGTLTPPQKCSITGKIKAEGFVIGINKEIPFSGNLG